MGARRIVLVVAAVMLSCVAAPAAPALAAGLFTDDDGSAHEGNIDLLAANGIAQGCGGTSYCPGEAVTRGQMATFLARALRLPVSSQDHFSDDDDSRHEESINALVGAGVTSGYADGVFRPATNVTRGQMATFLANAFGFPPADTAFPDVAGVHEPGVGAVAAAGVSAGFSDGTFRPDEEVTRGQMASFLIASLEWSQTTPPGEAPELPDVPSSPGPGETTTAAVSWQRTGTLYCTLGWGEASVTAPTVHASGYTAWIPIFFYLDANGNYTGSYAWGEWEWSRGTQPTGIIAAPPPWHRFRDGAVGGLQRTTFTPHGRVSVQQVIYDYDTGQYSWDWARSVFGNTTFCTG